ncbi:hypothetical protein OAV62_02075 [bacterium]|nr:hypothetical protein [bacterium]
MKIKNQACTRCDYACYGASALNKHVKAVHDKIKDFTCTICAYATSCSSHLKRHLSQTHDIGKHPCDYCSRNRNTSISFSHPNTPNLKSKICRECFKKATGKESRAEERVSAFLDKIVELKPFLIGTDDSFKTMGGCSLKRPDKLYISEKVAIWFECDEHQHQRTSSTYTCEERRISDAYDEFDGQKLIVIRWNPDKYKCTGGMKCRSERLRELANLVKEILDDPPIDPIYIYYMFYNRDNPQLSRRIPHTLIF